MRLYVCEVINNLYIYIYESHIAQAIMNNNNNIKETVLL